MKKQYIVTLILTLLFNISFAQRGKDGAKIVTGTEIVNAFTMLTADATAGSSSISVTNSNLNTNFSGNLSQGDLLMLIQVQGVSIEDTINTSFGNSSKFFNTWGRITNYNNCGNYEFVQVTAVPSTTSITLDCSLQFDYTATGKVLVIRVPRYTSLTINSGAQLTTSAWNGTSGGILAVEVNGITTINSGGSIDVSNLGFRGGTATNSSQSSVFGGSRFADSNPLEGAEKGEGIYGSQTDYDLMNDGGARLCRGAPANGGGGGNEHNAGGGGGANAGNPTNWNDGVGNPDFTYNTAWALETPSIAAVTSSGGGRGGYSFFGTDQNEMTTAPGNAAWSGNNRRVAGGLGGRPLDYSTGKIFIGGGGGAGEGNDGEAGDGGNGGGIIFMTTYGNITGAGDIIANGEDGGDVVGTNVFGQLRGKDAGGGAGGGGTIILQTTGSVTLSGNIDANGGIGGDQTLVAGSFASIDEGEGPGGGGGYIAISAGTPTRTANGGISGVTNCPYVSNFPVNGATNGGIGMPNENINSYEILANGTSICSNTAASLSASLSGNPPAGATIEWYDAEFGGTLLFTGANFTTPILTTNTTYWVKACPAPYLIQVDVTVTACAAMVADFSATDSTLCIGDCIDFTDLTTNTPTGWTWYFFGSATANSAVQNPTNICYNTAGNFDVVLVANNASLQDSLFMPNFITVSALPNVVASATDTNVCLGDTTTLNGSGATSYTWTNPIINGTTFSPTATTLYTVTGTDTNGCINSDTLTINVNALPIIIANATNTSICTGDSVTLTGSGAASYTWDNSVVDGVSFIPAGTQTYTVTGTDANGCSNTDQITLTVNTCNVPPIASFGASDSTICIDDCINFNDLSTAAPTGWIWYFFGSATANSGVQNPTNICYNTAGNFDVALVATNSTGQDSLFIANFITVNALPTVVASATDTIICLGDSTILLASGANTYQWFNNLGQTVSDTLFPSQSGFYLVQGTDINGCVNNDRVVIQVNNCTTPATSFSNVPNACINDCIDFTDNSANTPTSWVWYFFGGNPATATTQNPTNICFDTTGVWAVALVTSNAFGTDSVYVGNALTVDSCNIITNSIFIPNVLTPNGDGQNDIFVIDGNGITTLHTQIYNRWGILLYESNLVREGWDGRTRAGVEVPEGTYFYVITAELGGAIETYKGTLTLIR